MTQLIDNFDFAVVTFLGNFIVFDSLATLSDQFVTEKNW
jgi:hypothetical protein